jgi:hypothetical protein
MSSGDHEPPTKGVWSDLHGWTAPTNFGEQSMSLDNNETRAALAAAPVVSALSGLDEYLDQLQPPKVAGYPDDPVEAFASGFGWALDAVADWLDGAPWEGGKPPATHKADGTPLRADPQ